MNLFTKQNQNQRFQKLRVTKGDRWGERWIGCLGLAYAHYFIWNELSMGTCCIAQGTLQYSVITYMGKTT